MRPPLPYSERIRKLQACLSPKTHQADCPEKFRAIARWWRLEALDSATPETCREYARGQDWIAADLENRARHHGQKPLDVSRYQWSQR